MRNHRHHGWQGQRPMHGQLIAGSLIIFLGVIFLLDNLNIIESRQVLRLWPLLLVFAGLKNLFETTDRGGAVRGTLVASAGALLLLNSLDIISFRFWQLWPLLLIVFGFQGHANIARTVESRTER